MDRRDEKDERDCKRIFKWPSIGKVPWLMHNGIINSFFKFDLDINVFKKIFNWLFLFVFFSTKFLVLKPMEKLFRNKHFSSQNIDAVLPIDQIKVLRVLYKWRVTWYYDASPFKCKNVTVCREGSRMFEPCGWCG